MDPHPLPPLEILPRDLAPYRRGNVGIDYVHRFDSGRLGSGTPLIQHGLHGTTDHHGVALVAECGQHFRRASGDTAIAVTMGFLAHFGLVGAEDVPQAAAMPEPQRFELLQTVMVRTPTFRFTRPLVGFEAFDEGDLIATDGDEEIRAPCPRCTVLMPTREPIVGREAVYLSRPLDAAPAGH